MERSLRSWQAPRTVITPRDDPTEVLFDPALARSVEYKRAVGYFTSNWIARNARGLARLAANGGRARWITSPHLSEADWFALQGGSAEAGQVVERSLMGAISDLERNLAEDTLNTISWMVNDGLLEFRIAVANSDPDSRDFHTKLGVFCDESGPAVAFVGSMNETERGTRNHEVVSVFSDAREGEIHRVLEFDAIFEALWDNHDPQYKTYTLPQAAREKLVKLKRSPRPYKSSRPSGHRGLLRPYQQEAMKSWRENGERGILEMATGTGKTITALACIETALEDPDRPTIVLVACPFQHLVDQWAEQLDRLGMPVIRAHGSSATWRPEVHRLRGRLELGTVSAGIVVTTYATLTSDNLVHALDGAQEQIMFVADECHYLGARGAISGMDERYRRRLGLSATPSRHYDEEGTKAIMSYFGGVVFEFGMEKAITEGFLVPYEYYPEFVELSEEESEEYLQISERIARLLQQDNAEGRERAKRLAIQRARILNNASSKLDWLREHLYQRAPETWDYTLVYAGDKIFNPVTELIGQELRIRQHEFTSRQSRGERKRILERFADRDLQILTAMKCLDEGVDVPPTRTAYFLASSGNPREFVQRRGRVLRTAPGKASATIFDAIAVPPKSFLAARRGSSAWKTGRAALKAQLSRIEEFSRLATNRVHAENAVFHFRLEFDLPLTSEGDSEDA